MKKEEYRVCLIEEIAFRRVWRVPFHNTKSQGLENVGGFMETLSS